MREECNFCTHHEGSKDVSMGYGAPMAVVFLRMVSVWLVSWGQCWGPLQDERVHGALEQSLDDPQAQHFVIWKGMSQ